MSCYSIGSYLRFGAYYECLSIHYACVSYLQTARKTKPEDLTMDELVMNETLQEVTSYTSGAEWILFPHDVIFLIINIMSVVANSLTIYIIARNKSMHAPTYMYILHIAIFDLLYHIITPINIFVPFHRFFKFYAYCLAYDVECGLQTAEIALFIMLSFDRALQPANYKKFILGTWSLASLVIALHIVVCSFDKNSLVPILLAIASYIALLFVHFVFSVQKYRKSYDDDYRFRFVVISVYVGSWAINLIALLLSFFPLLENFAFNLSMVTTGMGYLYAVANVLVLALFDKRFRLYLFQTTSCSNNVYRDVHVDFENTSPSANLKDSEM